MKNILIFFIFVFLIRTTNGNESWISVNSPVTTSIFTAAFVTENIGVIGTFYKICRTTNGGDSWDTVYSGNMVVRAIGFAPDNSNVGYAACYDNGEGVVFKTTNQGINWIELNYQISESISDILVLNQENLYISTHNGNVFYSGDAGITWNTSTIAGAFFLNQIRINNSTLFGVTINECWKLNNDTWENLGSHGIFAYSFEIDSSFGVDSPTFFIGGTTIDTNLAVIRSSTNMGVSWTETRLPEEGAVQALFSFEMEGYAAGWRYNSTIGQYQSCIWKRAGNNWSLDTVYQPPNMSDRGFRKLAVAGLEALFAVGAEGVIMKHEFDTALPIELSSFSSVVSGSEVTLNWVTSSETNNAQFSVERKQDETSWQTIGTVLGSGTTTMSHSYNYIDRQLSSGIYSYRLKQIDYNGNYEYFNLSHEVIIGTPTNYYLSQNYPNPFNPTTTITYNLPDEQYVTIKIFDISGKEVMNLMNNTLTPAGYHRLTLDATTLSSGIYFYRLTAGTTYTNIKKMMVVK